MRAPLFVIPLVLSVSLPCWAEIMVGESIEWRTVDSTLIVKGRVSGVKTVRAVGQRRYEDVTVAVDEVLKGRPAGSVTFRWSRMPHDPDARVMKRAGSSVVFFLVEGVPDIEGGVYAGRWMPRTPSIPEASLFDLSSLAGRRNAALRADATRARTPDEVLDAVRRQVRHLRGRRVLLPGADARRRSGRGAVNVFDPEGEFTRVELQPGSDAYAALYAGSSCYLVVPSPRFAAP